MDKREDVTPAPEKVVLTLEEQIRLMETNKMLEELIAKEELVAEMEAKLEEERTKFNDYINAVNEETNITVSEVDEVDCLKIFLRERTNWTGTVTIDAAANHRDHIEQQVKVIVASKPEGQIQIKFA